MFFLIRIGFWFSLLLLALPLGAVGSGGIGPLEALVAAREAVGDVAGLCGRKPEVCVTGRAAFETIGTRARAAGEIAYRMVDEKAGGVEMAAEPDRTIATGSVMPKKALVPQPRPEPTAAH